MNDDNKVQIPIRFAPNLFSKKWYCINRATPLTITAVREKEAFLLKFDLIIINYYTKY